MRSAAMRCSALAAALLTATQVLIIPAAAAPQPRDTLRVGITGSPPFVLPGHGSRGGISLEIWRRVAEQNGLTYDFIEQPTPKQGLKAIDVGEIDLLVGPISITSGRLAMPGVDFHSPTSWASPASCCLSPPPDQPPERVVRVGGGVFGAGAAGRAGGSGQPDLARRAATQCRAVSAEPLAGIGSGMWFALVRSPRSATATRPRSPAWAADLQRFG